MADVAVVSLHDKGFWCADLYRDASKWDADDWENGYAPDSFRTFAKGGEQSEAVDWSKENWPGAQIRIVSEDDEEGEVLE